MVFSVGDYQIHTSKRGLNVVDSVISLRKAAKLSIEKNSARGGLMVGDLRASVYLVLDYSGSMRMWYRNGGVQQLINAVMALSAELDDDGVVTVVPFSSKVHGTYDIPLSQADNFLRDFQASEAGKHMGTTNYHDAMLAVHRHHQDSDSREPALVVFQTDGAPDNRSRAEAALRLISPDGEFFQFFAFGDENSSDFDFLRKLDDLDVPVKRRVDNASFTAFRDINAATPEAVFDAILQEFPGWVRGGKNHGVPKLFPTKAPTPQLPARLSEIPSFA